MKKFIGHGFLFFLVLVCINMPFYLIIEDIYWRYYKDVDLNFNNFLFGDSHGRNLKDLPEEHDFFNFSAGSDNYEDMLRKLNYLIREGDVDTIIISAEDHTLSSYREILNNNDRSAYFTHISDYKNFYVYIKEKYIKNYFVLLNSKHKEILYMYIKRKIKKNIFSEVKEEKKWEALSNKEKMINAEKRANTQFKMHHKSEEMELSLRNLIETCLNSSIYVVGVKYPLSREYIKTLNNQSFYADEVFNDQDIPILDFSEYYLDKDEYFLDQDHLNEKGAKEFNKILFNTLRNLDDE